ncbi:ABC transporter-like [Syntrophomonas zehnderi OL-4]|uniref:ABC transporter-like n=1 Tax=Syntrophomonas zehnderi OL-4 TaxID=690567 RepID=A0A0E4C920_9FIRM|nr:ABC transporter ATP-binding protein [Syntrophomonas zehnderi]CFX82218.1 ABC transporter-like [Syntrophomonas zehnderi OL-4]
MIKLDKITKTYYNFRRNKKNALEGIDLCVSEGEMVAIVGSSGAGKSTLLNILGGIDRPNSGHYYFDNKLIEFKAHRLAHFRRNNIGFIVQDHALIDDMTAYDNIALPLKYRSMNKAQIEKRVMDIAYYLNIKDQLYNYPTQLSGGECQRIAIARAIINKPRLILADEPTGSLDSQNKRNVMSIFKDIHRNSTTIIVTHDYEIANTCHRVVELNNGRITKH